MLEKKKITKGLFCCVCVLLLVVTVVVFPVSADSNTDIHFFDFDEYSTYTYDESTGLITADVQLPSSWQWSYVHDGANFATWYNSFNFTTFGIDSPLACDFNSFAKVSVVSTINKAQIQLGNFLDLQYLPSGSTLNVELVTAFMDRNLVSNFADVFVAFVDSTGKVLSYSSVSTSVEVYQMGRDGQRYTVTASYTFDSVPTGAKGFYYITRVSSGLSVDGAEIPVVTSKNSIVFKYSEQDYNIKQDKIIRDKVSNIDKQLGELPDRIGDEVKDVIEQEKDESKEEGNKFVDQILDALPDPSQDVLVALKGLTDATAYTGTDAVLPIPAIVLPGIDGMFPETEVWGGTEFDFGEYIGMLPATLLTLVQSLFTIAIVLFCVYELKGIISYCLTLRESKGG